MQLLETLDTLNKAITMAPKSFAECVKWARLLFEDYFHNTIEQLLFNFSPDQVKADVGCLRHLDQSFFGHVTFLSPPPPPPPHTHTHTHRVGRTYEVTSVRLDGVFFKIRSLYIF